MERLRLAMVLVAAVALPAVVLGSPVPVWQNTLENDGTSTVDGGTIVGGSSTYVPGADGNAFAGNGSVYARWDNATVANIFDGAWNNSLGSTIDLYFRGDHWSTHSGDSGLFSVVDRLSSYDGHFIISVRSGKLRLPYRDSYNNAYAENYLTGVPLADNTTYRLTVRQYNGVTEVYLDGGAYSNAAPVYTGSFLYNGQPATCSFPAPNAGTGSSGRQMNVGNRSSYFGGILQSGEWVDNIRVYNGYYTPAEIGVPEPASLLLLAAGMVPLLRRRHG